MNPLRRPLSGPGADPVTEADGTLPPLLEDEPGDWVPDVLEGFERRTLGLGEDEQGPLVATLVRPADLAADPTLVPVLLVHGWSDYFYNAPLARGLQDAGYAPYALDLRRYGRSLRAGQTPGWTDTLRAYDEDLEAALEVVAHRHPRRPVVLAHSTGGLTVSLWADRNPGRLSALVLNSPWLDMHGSAWVRTLARVVVDPLSSRDRHRLLRLPRFDLYWRTLAAQADGDWDLHAQWRPPFSFEIPAAWVGAVVRGHARVAAGLDVDVPVLTLVSDRAVRSTRYSPDLRRGDAVLDPRTMAQKALLLGDRVTVHRHRGALHDVFASAVPVRSRALEATVDWLGRVLG